MIRGDSVRMLTSLVTKANSQVCMSLRAKQSNLSAPRRMKSAIPRKDFCSKAPAVIPAKLVPAEAGSRNPGDKGLDSRVRGNGMAKRWFEASMACFRSNDNRHTFSPIHGLRARLVTKLKVVVREEGLLPGCFARASGRTDAQTGD